MLLMRAIDFYGHGHSAIPHVDYTSDLLCQQLEDLLIQLDLCNLHPKEDHNDLYIIGKYDIIYYNNINIILYITIMNTSICAIVDNNDRTFNGRINSI